jgi:EmrB/QacA subfamily drug resistance transporter
MMARGGPLPDRARAVLGVVGFGTLLAALSGSMVTLTLPTIGRELGLSVDRWHWIIQSFLLANAVLLLPVGRLGDLLSHRRVYLAGVFVYAFASLVCGLAVSFAMLVLGRVLQGVGAAMAMATGPAVLTTSLPSANRGRALGIVSSATYAGLTLGPPFAGFVLGLANWRAVFLVGVPVGLIIGLTGMRFLPRIPATGERRFDWGGAAALAGGLLLLLLSVGDLGRWKTSLIEGPGLALVGLLILAGFLLWQRRGPVPLLDLSLFRSRVFTGAIACALTNYAAVFSATLLLPFFLEEGLGVKPALIGLVLSVQPLVMALVASPSGALSDRIGTRGLIVGGIAILAGGLVGLSSVGSGSSPVVVAAWLGVMGFGTGIFISPNSSALLGSAPRARQGTASSLIALSRIVGMLLGVAQATLVFQVTGGRTGAAWRTVDFGAFEAALRAGAVVAGLGVLVAVLRGPDTPAQTTA